MQSSVKLPEMLFSFAHMLTTSSSGTMMATAHDLKLYIAIELGIGLSHIVRGDVDIPYLLRSKVFTLQDRIIRKRDS